MVYNYKSINGLAPEYLCSKFGERSRVSGYSLRDTTGKLAAPFPCTNYLKNSFSYSGAVIPYHTIPYYTKPYHTIPYRTVPYRTIPYHTIPYHTIPYHTIPYHTIPYHTIPYHIISYHTIIYHTIPYHWLKNVSSILWSSFVHMIK